MKIIAYTLTLLLIAGISSLAQSPELKKTIDGERIVIPGIKNEPGIGRNEGDVDVESFILPPGIRMVERPGYPFNPDPSMLRGNSNAFYVAIHLVNDNVKQPGDSLATGAPVQMIINEGLVMMNTAPARVQNGMLMDRVLINLPPTGIGAGGIKEKQDTVTIYLAVSCLNKDRAIPWEENQNLTDDVQDYPIAPNGMYTITGYVKHTGLKQLITLLQGYPKLKLTRHYNPRLTADPNSVQPEWLKIYDLIQEMVWKVTDGPGITKSELDAFKKELAPYK